MKLPGTCLCNSPAGYLFPGIAIGEPHTVLKALRHPIAAFDVPLTGWLMVGFFYRPHCYRLPYGA